MQDNPPHSASHPLFTHSYTHTHSSPIDSHTSKTELRRAELHWAEIRSQSLEADCHHIYSDVHLILLKIKGPDFNAWKIQKDFSKWGLNLFTKLIYGILFSQRLGLNCVKVGVTKINLQNCFLIYIWHFINTVYYQPVSHFFFSIY